MNRIDYWRLYCSLISSDQPSAPQRWATPDGVNYSRPFTPEFGRCCSFTAGGRSTQPATAFSLHLMAHPERSDALARSAKRWGHRVWKCVAAYTPGNANSWAKTLQESPCTLALASLRLPVPARYWSRRPSAIWWPAQGFPSTSAENIASRGVPDEWRLFQAVLD